MGSRTARSIDRNIAGAIACAFDEEMKQGG
jgi:hypothetical protein